MWAMGSNMQIMCPAGQSEPWYSKQEVDEKHVCLLTYAHSPDGRGGFRGNKK